MLKAFIYLLEVKLLYETVCRLVGSNFLKWREVALQAPIGALVFTLLLCRFVFDIFISIPFVYCLFLRYNAYLSNINSILERTEVFQVMKI